MTARRLKLTRAQRTQLAKDLFNLTWLYLRKRKRSRTDDEIMLHAAHASRHFWGEVGKPLNWTIGEWQLSRVYAVLGRPEPALHHARKSLAICREHGIGGFPLAYAYEALARASAVAARKEDTRRYLRKAQAAGQRIDETADRLHFLKDMRSVPRPRK